MTNPYYDQPLAFNGPGPRNPRSGNLAHRALVVITTIALLAGIVVFIIGSSMNNPYSLYDSAKGVPLQAVGGALFGLGIQSLLLTLHAAAVRND